MDTCSTTFGDDVSCECVIVLACYSNDLLLNMPDDKLKNIKHLVLCEGQLADSDKEAEEFSAGFYCALLEQHKDIRESICAGFKRVEKNVNNRSVQFHYYANGDEIKL